MILTALLRSYADGTVVLRSTKWGRQDQRWCLLFVCLELLLVDDGKEVNGCQSLTAFAVRCVVKCENTNVKSVIP